MSSQAIALDVTTLTPLACANCGGTGRVETITGSYTGWNGVVEPVYRAAPCERCDGTGDEPCAWCQEAVAVAMEAGDLICAGCATEDA